MPLWKLQQVRSGIDDFLYSNVGKGAAISLRPGVVYCLRAFHSQIIMIVEGAWVRWIRECNNNREILGKSTDLRTFLFGGSRATVADFRPFLHELQGGKCFYCENRLRNSSEVDHFIPWSRYPSDLAHNFVLAHRGCNNDKRDMLAARQHLIRWVDRNRVDRAAIAQHSEAKTFRHDLSSTIQIAHWAYSQLERSDGGTWVARGQPAAPLEPNWRKYLSL